MFFAFAFGGLMFPFMLFGFLLLLPLSLFCFLSLLFGFACLLLHFIAFGVLLVAFPCFCFWFACSPDFAIPWLFYVFDLAFSCLASSLSVFVFLLLFSFCFLPPCHLPQFFFTGGQGDGGGRGNWKEREKTGQNEGNKERMTEIG